MFPWARRTCLVLAEGSASPRGSPSVSAEAWGPSRADPSKGLGPRFDRQSSPWPAPLQAGAPHQPHLPSGKLKPRSKGWMFRVYFKLKMPYCGKARGISSSHWLCWQYRALRMSGHLFRALNLEPELSARWEILARGCYCYVHSESVQPCRCLPFRRFVLFCPFRRI